MSWFFERINKTDKLLTRFINKKRERTQINTIRNERGEITIDTTEIQRIVRNYYKQLYAKKLDILGERDKFLETSSFPKLNQERAENLKRVITTEIKTVIKKLTAHKNPGLVKFTCVQPHR